MCSKESFDEVVKKIFSKKEWFESESKLSNKEVSNYQFDTSSMSISVLGNYEVESKIVIDEPVVTNENSDLFEQAKKGVKYNCTIFREKKGFLHFNPTFRLYIEEGSSRKYLLSGKKNALSSSSQFVIYKDSLENEVAKLSSNFLGTCFNLVTHDEELGAVIYSRKFKRPRKFHFVVPSKMFLSKKSPSSVLESFKKKEFKDLICYRNKMPKWNEVTKSYVLNLNGKVKKPSTRNFKIVDRSENELVLLFGKSSKDSYVLEYSHPLCAVQAFGVALTTFSSF